MKEFFTLELAAKMYYDELVEQCRQGNTAAYRSLYQNYARAMYNTSLRILNHAADAEDIVQESFIEVLRNLDRFNYQATFGAWMKRIVINKSINHLRHKRIAFIELNAAVLNDCLEEESADDADMEFRVEKIKKAVCMLPDGYRTIFTLSAFEGYDFSEIAGILDISTGTARSQYHRAKKLLLTLLKQHL